MLDRKEFLNQTFLNLTVDKKMTWLHVEDVTPKPGHRVLLWGKDGSQEVGSLDHKIGMWNVRGQPVPFDNFTHWQMLPSGPAK